MSPEQAIREAEKRGAVEALRSAADEVRAIAHGTGLLDRLMRPSFDVIADLLRDRADRLDAQDGGEGRG